MFSSPKIKVFELSFGEKPRDRRLVFLLTLYGLYHNVTEGQTDRQTDSEVVASSLPLYLVHPTITEKAAYTYTCCNYSKSKLHYNR